ncbi:hypothetical protein WHR41_08384 [Cladosporium halotolerans]|uniref:STB6-like N-terminal domain-containing protein n=1 Tax=Cladosporium halotolerans TaxID=1052096 RepID=A0AB34KI03_9PEZI
MAVRQSMDERRSRPSQIPSPSFQRPTTAPNGGERNLKRVPTSERPEDVIAEHDTPAAVESGRQRFVLDDPVAFRYLEEDPSTTTLERRRELKGYECYIVEQWTTSRTHPTFVITTYTGDPSHVIVVGVLSVPTDESQWSPRLRIYFKALNQYHARRSDTPLGTLMVTNLSAFPSSLTVIPVPDGDLRKHRFDFFVNEDLKRLGCTGRVGLTLVPPSSATIAKFHQLYRTSDKNEIYKSVMELVRLCQTALTLFNKLDIDYADGLLCDVTENAVNDWWLAIGSDYYQSEPHDGILGPTTVAALLGLLMGARNRLHAIGAPVGKDAFDTESMKRGIGSFQKQQRLTKSRRLDEHTLSRLHRVSTKAASSDSWTVPRVVKSTVAELSGKGGEMVMDVVGGRDRAGIAEIETTDLERFVQLIYGERPKWLWYGKPMKKAKEAQEEKRTASGGLVFRPDEQGGFAWTGRKSTVDGMPVPPREQYDDLRSPMEYDTEDDDDQKRGLFKRATGLKNDAKSGLGKFKGVVGLGHHQKLSQEDYPKSPIERTSLEARRPPMSRSQTSPASSPTSTASTTQETSLDAALAAQRKETSGESETAQQGVNRGQSSGSRESFQDVAEEEGEDDDDDNMTDNGEPVQRTATSDTNYTHTIPTSDHRPSLAETNEEAIESGDELDMDPEHIQEDATPHRTLSLSHVENTKADPRPDEHYPRHLSFSLAEDSVLTWRELTASDSESESDDPAAQYAAQELRSKSTIDLRLALKQLSTDTADWTRAQLSMLQDIRPLAENNADRLVDTYQPRLESLQSLQANIEGLLRNEKEELEEGSKELETLAAKLEYEIDGLKSRVEDVEAGVSDFERSVGRVEDRVTELEKDGHGGRSWGCTVQ